MDASRGSQSLRDETGRIQRLDAAGARELVARFSRPFAPDDSGNGPSDADPIAAAAYGWLALDRSHAGHPPDVVGQAKTHLYLHGLLRLPLSVARELAEHRGHLYIDALTSITDAVAAELGRHHPGGLSLNHLRRLSPAAARALGGHGGELSLDRLAALDAAAAVGLARHANDLHLDGLRRLDPAAAAALAQHRGNLFLGGLVQLPARLAIHLARHRGHLHLHGVRRLNDASAAAFGARSGHLCLNHLERLTPRQARHLARHTGALHLDALPVDDTVAENLGDHVGALIIQAGNDVPLPRLRQLLRHRGPIQFTGLAQIDEPRAALLAAQPAVRGIEGLSGLFLDVTTITPGVAAILATHRAGGLALTGLRRLSADVAREIVRHPFLALDRVESLTDDVAAIVSLHAGALLSLRGLRDVSGAGLARLQRNPSIELPRRLLAHAA